MSKFKFVKMIATAMVVLSMTGCGISSTIKGILPHGEKQILADYNYEGYAHIDIYKISDNDYRVVERMTKKGMESMGEEDYVTEMTIEVRVTREGIEEFLEYEDFDIEL